MKRTLSSVMLLVLVATWTSIAADADPNKKCCGPCVCLICAEPKGTGPMTMAMTMARWAERADTLFVGKVVKAEVLPCCDLYADITFRVTKMWKGHAATSVSVRVGWGCAELFPFVLGREYLVLARKDGTPAGLLVTDWCFGVPEASNAGEQMQALDAWLQALQGGNTGG